MTHSVNGSFLNSCDSAWVAYCRHLLRLWLHLPPTDTFELLSRDNLDSLKVDSVTALPFATELEVVPASMEAIVPGYLAGHSPRERYMQLRDRAGR